MKTFWKVYTFFFMVIFPMILYYAISGAGATSLSKPIIALVYLGIALLLWGFLLWSLFRKMIGQVFKHQSRLHWLLLYGEEVQAEVATRQLVQTLDTGEKITISLRFNNFSNTPSVIELKDIIDSKPYERRFEPGAKVLIRVDRQMRFPFLALGDTQVVLDKKQVLLRIIGFLAALAFFVGYLLFSYQYENNGHGWRFLIFWHPLIIIPLSYFFFGGLMAGILGRFLLKPEEETKFLLFGKETIATIDDVQQTGTYINEQPQVKFALHYEDETGQMHQVTFKQIVNLLDMHTVSQKERRVRYLPDAVQKVKFV